MKPFWEQLAIIWQRIDWPQRIGLILLAGVFALAVGIVMYMGSQPDYRVLASGLTRAQTAEIVNYLESQGEPYQLADRDTTVLVSQPRMYPLRTILAEQGMMGDGSDGFELLNEAPFGISTFREQKQYDRAVAGELQRSFKEIPGVRSARVLITRAPASPFLRDEQPSTAAVKLEMAPGQRLSDRQLAGIIHLTSGAVEGLSPDQVMVADDTGLLTQGDEDPGALRAGDALAAEEAHEQHLSDKAQAMLDRVLGPGRSLVKVTVDLDFTKRSTAERLPLAGQVKRSRTVATDESTPIPSGGGVAGTAANIEAPGNGAEATNNPATRTGEEDEREFTLGERTTATEDEVGLVRGMTVSILLDHQQEVDDEGGVTYVPYPADDQTRFQQLVLDAIGYEAARGARAAVAGIAPADVLGFSVSVDSMRFHAPAVLGDETAAAGSLTDLTSGPLMRYAGIGLALIVALGSLFIVRGQLKRAHAAYEAAEAERRRRAEEANQPDPNEVAAMELEARAELKDRIRREVDDNPQLAAGALRAWLLDA
jgi:flagellar M-ring protein FliF